MKTPPFTDAQAGRARTVIILIMLLLAAGAVTVWRVVLARPSGPANTIVLSGRIEGDDSAVSSKAMGRLLEAKVHQLEIALRQCRSRQQKKRRDRCRRPHRRKASAVCA